MGQSQFKHLVLCFVYISVLAAAAPALCSEHPSENYPTNQPWLGYGTDSMSRSAEWNMGDLTFVPLYPDPSTLSREEVYMLMGLQEDCPVDLPAASWDKVILEVVQNYYVRQGSLPTVVDDEVYATAFGMDVSQVPDLIREVLKSPITGHYPRIDQASFSPGEFYIRALSESEMRYYADLDSLYNHLWFGVPWIDGLGNVIQDQEKRELWGPVYYLRMYGRNDVILNMITFYVSVQK